MKIFKFLVLVLAGLALLTGSCKKDSNGPKKPSSSSYYIKLKLNGELKQYTFNATSLLSKPSVYACELTALLSNTNTAGVTVGLTDGSAFVTDKTYTEAYIVANGTTTIQGMITYKTEDGTIYFASATAANTSLRLQFSEIANDHLKGTFSGTFLKVGSSPLVYAPITEGEFYVGRSL